MTVLLYLFAGIVASVVIAILAVVLALAILAKADAAKGDDPTEVVDGPMDALEGEARQGQTHL